MYRGRFDGYFRRLVTVHENLNRLGVGSALEENVRIGQIELALTEQFMESINIVINP